MRPSSPSHSHCSPTPIKVLHKQAKKKPIRRRRIDLNCGCSYYLHINCTNHGFTHRGTHHCSSSSEWRVYLGAQQSPIFQDNKTHQPTIQQEPRHDISPNPFQPQSQEKVGDSQVLSELPDLDDLTASNWSFLKGL
uniref:Transcriptional activator protein n=1 Tax=Tomato leaf curl Mali virus TaxID=260379 RepID=A0A5C1D5K2_9GEMI|nr:transcription activator protein [Tomato leaf curl Mali virus]